MNIEKQTSAQRASAATSKPGDQLLSNVYKSRRGRSPSEPKGMANADTVMARLESGLPLKDALIPGASYEGWHRMGSFSSLWLSFGLGIVVNFEVFTGEAQMTTALVQFDEALAVGLVVCFGLCWRLFAAQRREMIRRAKAERRARELAHLDLLTGLPNRRQFDKDLKSAIAAPPSAEVLGSASRSFMTGERNQQKWCGVPTSHSTGQKQSTARQCASMMKRWTRDCWSEIRSNVTYASPHRSRFAASSAAPHSTSPRD